VPKNFRYGNLEFDGPAYTTAQHLIRNIIDEMERGQTIREINFFKSKRHSWRLTFPHTHSARHTINFNRFPWVIWHISEGSLDVRCVRVHRYFPSKSRNQLQVVHEYTRTLKNVFLNITHWRQTHLFRAVESGYNDTGLYDTSPIPSDILWYQLIPHC
jgi:hypothetical protein